MAEGGDRARGGARSHRATSQPPDLSTGGGSFDSSDLFSHCLNYCASLLYCVDRRFHRLWFYNFSSESFPNETVKLAKNLKRQLCYWRIGQPVATFSPPIRAAAVRQTVIGRYSYKTLNAVIL